MEQEQVFKDVRKVVCDLLKVPSERVVPEARLVEDLDVDSLFITELALGLEAEFDIEVNDADMPRLMTVQSIVDYVIEKKDGG